MRNIEQGLDVLQGRGILRHGNLSVLSPPPPAAESSRTHLLSLLDVLHDKILNSGVLTEAQLSEHRSALIDHLKNPDTLLIDKLLVQAWGQKWSA